MMKHNYRLLILASILSAAFTSCELYNPAEKIPSYIRIEKITLSTTYITEGSNSSKITDAWLYIDDQLIGCFELPATIPVLAEGIHQLKIRPGIKVNGIASNRSPYPFFSNIDQQVDLQKGAVLNLSPTVTYLPTASIILVEDFEDPGVTIDSTAFSNSNLKTITLPDPNVFEGNKSAIGNTDPVKTFFEVATVNPYVLPTGGAPIFLEFNYKCNYPFIVSIIARGAATTNQFTVLNFNASTEWNKTYTYLTPTVSSASSAIDYKIVWGVLNNSGTDSTALLLDNIKLIK
ncbi:MAG TPA: hypothetical protein VGC65_08115 [Bacteroidia bacterium]|jgi:hypothetical protein